MKKVNKVIILIFVMFIAFSKTATAMFKNHDVKNDPDYELLCEWELQYDKKSNVRIYGKKNDKSYFAVSYQKESSEEEWVTGTVSDLNGNGTFSNSRSVPDVRVLGCPSAVFLDTKTEKELCFTTYFGQMGAAKGISSNCALNKNTGTDYGEDLVYSKLTKNNTGVDSSGGITGADIDEDFSGGEDCAGFLGNKGTAGTPAYYLHIILIAMRYVAIVLALVLSIIDFFKAVFSQDKDLLKKAAITAVKRVIFAVIIFFIPVILEFILGLLGAYTVKCV